MTRAYMTPARAVAHFSARAAERERRGLPRLAEDYRAVAGRVGATAHVFNAAMQTQEGT